MLYQWIVAKVPSPESIWDYGMIILPEVVLLDIKANLFCLCFVQNTVQVLADGRKFHFIAAVSVRRSDAFDDFLRVFHSS